MSQKPAQRPRPAQRLMKHGLDRGAVARLASALAGASTEFDASAFERSATRGLDDLELKARVQHVVRALDTHLPRDFAAARALVLRAGAAFPPGDGEDPLRGFAAWPLIDWVAGQANPHRPRDFDQALSALRELTPLFTAEFALRPFLLSDTARAMAHVARWTKDPNPKVRRLASEGIRPRLPWAPRLPMFVQDPAPVLEMLERLKDDPADSVRRSVANNLNDIAKDHPDLAVDVARRWAKDASAERTWIVRHATRTLVKQGHPGVLAVLGYTDRPRVEVALALKRPQLKLGGALELHIRVRSTAKQPQRLVIDYAIHHRKANGTLAPKVFKLRTLELAPGETFSLTKHHAMRPISTRRYHPGEHAVELLVNGKPHGRTPFTLKT